MDKSEIDEVILVGGSTRIPKIQAVLQDFFPGKKMYIGFPDEATVYGATVQAAILNGCQDEHLNKVLILDAVSHSFGIENMKGEVTTLIKRNTTIPTKMTHKFTTDEDNQREVVLHVVEVEGDDRLM